MRGRFSPSIFLVTFCIAYIAVFAADCPLFRYYPLHGDLSWGRQSLKGVGPAMAWYGLMANAGIASAILALLIPEKLAARVLCGRLWLFPAAAMIACSFLLRQFFR